MHERNPYKEPLDFSILGESYPSLKEHIFQSSTGALFIDFKDPLAQRRLTEALLHCDFNLSLNLPGGRLCPPVPNRLNYLLWLQDILNATSPSPRNATGVDIGTGASAIYPLLGCRLEPAWRFIGTEIDEISRRSALANVNSNGLSDQIQVLKATAAETLLFPLSLFPDTAFDFTMCNPPFYGSVEEVEKSAEAKLYGPSAVCTGAEVEMITPGGESNFVCQMVVESVALGTRCRWYTSMLGKLSSVADVVEAIRKNNVDNYGITEFIQGRTRRWAVAWSFGETRLPDTLSRTSSESLQGCMPLPNMLRQHYPVARSLQQLGRALQIVLAALDSVHTQAKALEQEPSGVDQIKPDSRSPSIEIHVLATQNTWSRAARRKKTKPAIEEVTTAPVLQPNAGSSALECVIRSSYTDGSVDDSDRGGHWFLECVWVRGSERALFESFWSHVSRKIGANL